MLDDQTRPHFGNSLFQETQDNGNDQNNTSSEAFKSVLNSMTPNLSVDNTTQTSGTWRRRTPPRNSWLKLDENTLDQTLDEYVISVKKRD